MNRTHPSNVLVVGATGMVGGATVRALLARGASVRALVRSRRPHPELRGVEITPGDLLERAAVERALDGVDAAFYVSPHEPEEELIAEHFVSACESAGVRLVFVGVHVDGATRLGRALRRGLFGRMLAQYSPKFRISERARTSRTQAIVLMPTNFYQNDELVRDELLRGRFIQPLERRVNRVDVRDIGEAAARACLDVSLPSGAYPVVGPESLDGRACAATWSAVLGREVRYEDDPSRFNAALARTLRGKKLEDFVASYQAIRGFALPTRTHELERTTALLGRPPNSYLSYVNDTAQRWLSEDAADTLRASTQCA